MSILPQSLAFGETQILIEDSVQRFVQDCYDFADRRARVAAESFDALRDWPQYAERGFLALPFPESVGGVSGKLEDIAVAASALGSGLTLEPFIEVAVIAGSMLRILGAGESELASIIGGTRVVVLADGCSGPHDQVICSKDGDGFVLNGRVRVVLFGEQAHELLIAARDESSQGVMLFSAPAHTAGLRCEGFRLMDKRPAADIVLTQCRLSATQKLAEGAQAESARKQALTLGVIAYCAEAFGIMGALLTQTTEYLRTRVQFGVAIGTFQALQHRVADLYIRYRESMALLRECVSRFENDSDDRAIEVLCVVFAENARLIAHEAIQMHGGIGVTNELPISHYNGRLVVIERLYLTRESRA